MWQSHTQYVVANPFSVLTSMRLTHFSVVTLFTVISGCCWFGKIGALEVYVLFE